MAKTNFKTIDEYHKLFSGETLHRMKIIRELVHTIAPEVEEVISYQIPAFKIGEKFYLIYYSAYSKHISISSPWSKSLLKEFEVELRGMKVSKSAIQFPHNKDLPIDLLKKILKFRKKENVNPITIATNASKDLKEISNVHLDILKYNDNMEDEYKKICNVLSQMIMTNLKKSENKLWHSHPVWFLDGNPIVGYSKQKKGIRLMFWSGADFEEDKLNIRGEKFKDASLFYNKISEINETDLKRWLKKSKEIQWDYKNLVKRKGKLEKIK